MFSVILLYSLVLDVALLVSIARTEIEAVLVRGTRDADVVVGDEPSLEDFILPVGVSVQSEKLYSGLPSIPQLFVVQQFEAFGIRQCNFVGDGLETERAADIDACLSLFRLLGGDDNHAVGTLAHRRWRATTGLCSISMIRCPADSGS